ncbi:unnamed protein product [Calicophoron daubneyi]|uniref:PLAT domain-containing protein n=1 Tax=Calicophoron daubneyi TaxID=300641 RepID=A0AAV2TC57_CALDB
MAELATIIKEVAEELVDYFNKRSLEVGWDDSIPKAVAEHLLPIPRLATRRIFRNVDDVPGLRKLLVLMESEGIGVNEPMTEEYIKTALEDCITKLNYLSYQDLCYSFGQDARSRSKLKDHKGDVRAPIFTDELLPPVTGLRLPKRRVCTAQVNRSRAERIVLFASKMIANLLRLTKKAYIEHEEQKSSATEIPLSSESTEKKRRHRRASFIANEGYRHQDNSTRGIRPKQRSKVGAVQTLSSAGQTHTVKIIQNVNLTSSPLERASRCTLFQRATSESPSDASAMRARQVGQVLRRDNEILDTNDENAAGQGEDPGNAVRAFSVINDNPVAEIADPEGHSALRCNLKHIESSSCDTKGDTNPSAHKGSPVCNRFRLLAHGKQVNGKVTSNYPEDIFQKEPVLPGYPVEFSKAAKYADVIPHTELLEQARKYGSPSFVTRLAHEIQRMQAKSEEPIEGYWMARNRFYSPEVYKLKCSPNKNPPTSSFRSLDRTSNSDITSTNTTVKTEHRLFSPALNFEISSSNTHEYSQRDLSSTLSKSTRIEQFTPHHERSPFSEGVRSVKLSGKGYYDVYERGCVSSTDPVVKPLRYGDQKADHNPLLSLSNSEETDQSAKDQIQKLAHATACVLSEAFGIRPHETAPRSKEDSSRKVSSGRHHNTGPRTQKGDSTEVASKRPEKGERLPPPECGGNIVYRVRVESVRRFRMKHANKYKDLCLMESSQLPNPTPPMSIVLCGSVCSSPSLKLVTAELARLGEVGGRPVILRDPYMMGKKSGRNQQIFGDVPKKPVDSTMLKHSLAKDGCPQVDYFAVVCSPLGRLTGVEVTPVGSAVRQSHYEWYIKTITIDELDRHKRCQFHCNKWLSIDERVLKCKRKPVNAKKTRSKTQATLQKTGDQLPYQEKQRPTSLNRRQHEVHSAKVEEAIIPEQVLNNMSQQPPTVHPEIAKNSNPCDLKNDRVTKGTLKPTTESILVKFPKIFKPVDRKMSRSCIMVDKTCIEEHAREIKERPPTRTANASNIGFEKLWEVFCMDKEIMDTLYTTVFPEVVSPNISHSSLDDKAETSYGEIIWITPYGMQINSLRSLGDLIPNSCNCALASLFQFHSELIPASRQTTIIDAHPNPDVVHEIEICEESPVFSAFTQNGPVPYLTSTLDIPTGCPLSEESEAKCDSQQDLSEQNETRQTTENDESSEDKYDYGTTNWEQDDSVDGAETTTKDAVSLNSTAPLDSLDDLSSPEVESRSPYCQSPLPVASVCFDPDHSVLQDVTECLRQVGSSTTVSSSSQMTDASMEERLRRIANVTVFNHPLLTGNDAKLAPESRVNVEFPTLSTSNVHVDVGYEPETAFGSENQRIHAFSEQSNNNFTDTRVIRASDPSEDRVETRCRESSIRGNGNVNRSTKFVEEFVKKTVLSAVDTICEAECEQVHYFISDTIF